MDFFIVYLFWSLFTLLPIANASICGSPTRRAPSGVLTSPNYPNQYPSNLDCNWEIIAPPGYMLRIRFTNISLEQSKYCQADYLQISNKKQISFKYCGNDSSYEKTLRVRAIQIRFVTDSYNQSSGFRLEWEIRSVVPNNNNVCGESVYSNSLGNLSSPGYDVNSYPNGIYCRWTILKPYDMLLRVHFSDFNIEHSIYPCVADYVAVYSGVERFIGIHCGNETPADSISNSDVIIEFFSDPSVNSRGFTLEWEAIPALCPHLPPLENGYSNCTHSRRADSVCFHQCNDGYRLVGNFMSQCIEDTNGNRAWENHTATCQDSHCSSNEIENGISVCSNGREIDSSCRFTCNDGYQLIGNSLSQCRRPSTGRTRWDPALPSCQARCTLNSNAIPNGVSSCLGSGDINTVCEHVCDKGYRIVGPHSSVCKAVNSSYAQWTPPFPICSGTPILSANANYHPSPSGNSVTFHCRFSGTPLPTVTWMFANGSNLPNNSQFQVGQQHVIRDSSVTRSLTVFGVKCQNASLFRFKCFASNQHTSTPVSSGTFIAGLGRSLLDFSVVTQSCTEARIHCHSNNGVLAVVPNQATLNQSSLRAGGNYWISSQSRLYFDGSGGANRGTPLNPDGCTRVRRGRNAWAINQGTPSYALCKRNENVPTPRFSVKSHPCRGNELNVTWTFIPGSKTLPHYVYMSGRKRLISPPGRNQMTLKNLSKNTTYRIQVTPMFRGCPASPLADLWADATTGREQNVVPQNIQIRHIEAENLCVIRWSYPARRITELKGFKIRLTANIANRRTDSLFQKPSRQPFDLDLTSRSFTLVQLVPNTDYHVEIAAVGSGSCDNVDTWSDAIKGQCITNTSVPAYIPLSATPPSFVDGFPVITLFPVSERNGPISCYFLVIHKSSFKSPALTEQDFGSLKQSGEILSDEDSYIAFATSGIKRRMNIRLGDGRVTCCDRNAYGSKPNCSDNRTRSTRAIPSLVRGQNRVLKPGENFTYYIVVTVPLGDSSLLGSSNLSNPITVPSVVHTPNQNGDLQWYIYLIIVFSAAFVVAIVLVVVFVTKRRKTDSPTQSIEREKQEEIIELPATSAMPRINTSVSGGLFKVPLNDNGGMISDINEHEHPYYEADIQRPSGELREFSIAKSDLRSVYLTKRENGNYLFKKEFSKTLPSIVNISIEQAKQTEHALKNRSQEVLPSDKDKVVLEMINSNWRTHYINASYVHGIHLHKAYIAAQSPMSNTVYDFWRMIVENNCTKIAMLTCLKENDEKKCARYWPDVGERENFGTTTVETVKEMSFGHYVFRDLIVTPNGTYNSLNPFRVAHYQYTMWPQDGVPLTTSSLLRFKDDVTRQSSDGTVLVHGSLGGGRTGTMLGLLLASEQLQNSDTVNFVEIAKKLREYRSGMIANLEQYMFLHKVMCEIAVVREYTDCTVSEFQQYMERMKRPNDLHVTNMMVQYRQLDVLSFLHDEPSTLQYARDHSEVKPYKRTAVTIRSSRRRKKANNAIMLNCSRVVAYNPRIVLMTTTTPSNSKDLELFWKCVMQHKVKCIVRINESSSKVEERTLKYGNFFVFIGQPEELHGYQVRNISIFRGRYREILDTAWRAKTRARPDWTLQQIDLLSWSQTTLPRNLTTILTVANRIRNSYDLAATRNTHVQEYKVIIHCSDGSTQSGAFCALVNILDRFKKERKIDIFRAVKDVRDCRARMVGNIQQYELLYNAAAECIRNDRLYEDVTLVPEVNPYQTVL